MLPPAAGGAGGLGVGVSNNGIGSLSPPRGRMPSFSDSPATGNDGEGGAANGGLKPRIPWSRLGGIRRAQVPTKREDCSRAVIPSFRGFIVENEIVVL